MIFAIGMQEFECIAVTPDTFIGGSVEREAMSLTFLLDANITDRVSLHHPCASEDEIRDILLNIPERLRGLITLHDYYNLAIEEHLAGGVQINARNEGQWEDMLRNNSVEWCRVSRSCHSIEEVKEAADSGIYEYVTLSPIYDSISKRGYKSHFDIQELSGILPEIGIRVVALGGVRKENFEELKRAGFSGAAMCGGIFKVD